MNKRKLILHIGPHKTGTTALQSFFSGNLGLLEQHSLYYPRTGCIMGGHHNLAWEILLFARFNPRHGGWTQLLQELASLQGQPTVLLSSEDFSLIPVSELSQLFSTLSDWEITVLCVYRPLQDFVESLYAEDVKNGRTCLSLSAYAADKVVFDQRVHLGTYLAMMIDNFGVKAKVIQYEGDVIPRVCSYLGLPETAPTKGMRANQRTSKEHLRRILTHRKQHSDLNWLSYFLQYVSPYLNGKATIEGAMAPEEMFVLDENLSKDLAAQDERNLDLFIAHERIDYDPIA